LVEFCSQYIKPHSDPPLNGALLFKWYNYIIMSPRDHFKQAMHSPYFSSPGYADTPSGKAEADLQKNLNKIKGFFKRLVRKK
jgi:hypothetical protein